jgi:hypothetical protein
MSDIPNSDHSPNSSTNCMSEKGMGKQGTRKLGELEQVLGRSTHSL